MSDGRNLAVRVGSALALFPLAVWLAWLGGLAFAAVCAAVAAVAAAELLLMFRRRLGAAEAFGVAGAGLLPLSGWISHASTGVVYSEWVTLGAALATVAVFGLQLFSSRPLEETGRGAAAVTLAWLYCGVLVTAVLGLRLRFGFGWVVLAFVVTWGNDTLAYFAGRLLGRHKLFPRVSPHKTWEGFAGGALGSIAGAFAVRALAGPLGGEPAMPAAAAWAVGLGAAVLAPVGDLAESMLKRAAGVKDSGRLVPGHGGLLDRIDALLFVGPWIYAVALLARG